MNDNINDANAFLNLLATKAKKDLKQTQNYNLTKRATVKSYNEVTKQAVINYQDDTTDISIKNLSGVYLSENDDVLITLISGSLHNSYISKNLTKQNLDFGDTLLFVGSAASPYLSESYQNFKYIIITVEMYLNTHYSTAIIPTKDFAIARNSSNEIISSKTFNVAESSYYYRGKFTSATQIERIQYVVGGNPTGGGGTAGNVYTVWGMGRIQ